MMTFTGSFTGPRRHDVTGTPLCDRCGRASRSWVTSLVDDAAICRGCTVIERWHPDSPGAWAAHQTEVRVGDYNYPEEPPDPIGAR